jgi:hypothetical protein
MHLNPRRHINPRWHDPRRRSGYAALRITLAMLVAAVALAFAPATPAQAWHTGYCPSATFCAFNNIWYYTDQGYEFTPVLNAGACDRAALTGWSSSMNSSGRTVRLYKTTNCTGDYKVTSNGSNVYRFSVVWGPSWDNSVRSIRFM